MADKVGQTHESVQTDSYKDLTEKDKVESPRAKRQKPTDGGSYGSDEMKQRVAIDRSLTSPREMAPPILRTLPWGGTGPPSKRLLLASSKHVEFCYDKDVPLVNDFAACAELSRLLRRGSRIMPEVSELPFPDKFAYSARADAVVSV